MQGSVKRRGSTWGYVIDVAPDPATGKRRQRTKSGFATKAAAEEAMRKAIAAGSSAGGDAQKLGDYLDEWITAAEVTTFLAGVQDDPLFALWVVLATTGLRRGEALGVRWSDIDLDRATLSVSQTITTVNNRIAVTPPKSDRSRRRIGLDRDTVRILRDHQRDQQRDSELLGAGPATLVFAEPDGGPVHPDTVTRRFKRLVRHSGLPLLRGPHDLRHTWASLALAAGAHPKVVSDRLGHSTIAITIDTYSHAIPSLDAEAASTVAGLLFTQ